MPRRQSSFAVVATLLTGASAVLDSLRRRARADSLQPERRNTSLAEAATALTSRLPFYHTSEQLRSETKRLAANCKGADADVRTVSHGGVEIDVISVRGKQATPINKVFMVFGEHSRELISPESGLHLLKALCSEEAIGPNGDDGAQALLQSEFQMVLNGNPRSRTKVESGEYCLRENPDGVDLNRNWDSGWQTDKVGYNDTHPGSTPFSEPETQIIRDLITAYKPTSFLSIHSGNLGLYMPWAYDREHTAERNKESMLQVMREVDAAHCECPFGAAGKEVGYACPGTSIDWAYDKLQTPYSFAYEIYLDPEFTKDMKRRWEEKLESGGKALLQEGETLDHPHFKELYHGRPSDFVQVAHSTHGSLTDEQCLKRFNPVTQEGYDAAVKNWASAYLDTARAIAKDISSKTGAKVA